MKLSKSKYLAHIFIEPVHLVPPDTKYWYILDLQKQI